MSFSPPTLTAAEVQFHTSSRYVAPKGYFPWVIRNDYPPLSAYPQGSGRPLGSSVSVQGGVRGSGHPLGTSVSVQSDVGSSQSSGGRPLGSSVYVQSDVGSPQGSAGFPQGSAGYTQESAGFPQGGPVISDPGRLPPGSEPAPWLDVDFKTEPLKYIDLAKEYFLEGMLEADFILQNNRVRPWYHAAWLHYSDVGREPIRGLTYEGPTPAYNLSSTQTEPIASWANAYVNERAASVYAHIWGDPNNPQADKSVRFPQGSVIAKTVFTTATDAQLPSQKGAPKWDAVISSDPEKPQPRNSYASTVRLIQLDVAVHDLRAPMGWVFGTYWYNGLNLDYSYDETKEAVRDKWNRLLPVGTQWGNDPQLTQKAYKAGGVPKEGWVNPDANKLLKDLGGKRPFLGWNERMNGPADGFISACLSCHSVAQIKVPVAPGKTEPEIVPPTPIEGPPGTWTPENDDSTMAWFRNIAIGEPFTPGAVSLDFNMQARIGLKHYYDWLNTQKVALGHSLSRIEVERAGTRVPSAPRTGPAIQFL